MQPGNPATAAQVEVWVAVQREPEAARWLIPVDLEFAGSVDVEALRAAMADLLARHPQLASSFASSGGTVARMPSDLPVPLRVDDRPGAYSRAEALVATSAVSGRPMALNSAPMLRAVLVRHPAGALLAMAVHHIVADGWSVDVLREHLVAAYGARLRGTPPALPPSAPPCPPDTDPDAAAEHWRGLLEGAPASLAPLSDRVRPAAKPGTARHQVREVDRALLERLHELAAAELASPAVTVLGVWALLLHAHSSLEDGLVGMPFSGRNDEATHHEVGLFTRLLPVRSRQRPRAPFREHLRRLRDQIVTTLELSADGDPPGVLLPSHQVVYAHYYVSDVPWDVAGTRVTAVERDTETAKHDLALACTERPGGMRLRLDYDASVYADDTVALLLDQMLGLLRAAVDGPDRSCRELVLGLADDLVPANRAAPAVPARTMAQLVLDRAAERPTSVAVRDGDRVVDYRTLVTRAAALAGWLQSAGVRREDVVALLLPAGADTVLAMLAVSLAGAAYLPLDPEHPDARLELVLADARARLLLTADGAVDRLNVDGLPAVELAEALAAAGAGVDPARPPLAPLEPIGPDNALTILYTSGSTGRPKGVVVTHGGMARLVGRPDFLPLGPDDVVSHLSPLNFDGATYEIWGALTAGAELVVLSKELVLSPRELREAIRRHGVTTLLVTTPLLNRIIEDAPDALQTVRRVYFGGEQISVRHISRALVWCEPGTLLHSYGPTENSFTSTWAPIREVAERARTVPIGRPVPGTTAYVVEEGGLDPVPRGVPGELLLGGAGVTRGYLGDPVSTAAAFVPDPFTGEPGGRLYRTGDRVRWTPDGQLEFLGRGDDQVKIRSQRVELGDVEAALRTVRTVRASFVTTRVDARGDKEIVGYVAPAEAVVDRRAAASAIRAELRRLLPPYALPAHLVVVDELPVTPNGKIDRQRLPDPVSTASAPVAAGPASTSRLRARSRSGGGGDRLAAVRAAWQDVLGRREIADDANFFDVGGHSLQLVSLQDALRRHTGVAPTIVDLLRHTTPRAHAEWLAASAVSGAAVAGWVGGSEPTTDDIAVVGMACRFAGADDVWEFWDNLRHGRDCMTQGTGPLVTRFADGARRVARYGALRAPVLFDADLFGFAPTGPPTDAQYGVLFECLWAAVEDGALRMADIADRTSLYVGCARSERADGRAARGERPVEEDRPVRADDVVGTDPTFLPTRFSYWHDLRGESVLVDTSCSTSLVAAHLACESLLTGRSDYALAGGVSIQDTGDGSYLSVPGQIFAVDGYCRPHDRRATGTVPGDGAGAVLLRRLSDAQRDGDPVHAVIRGSATNNDGRARVGYSAPGVQGQTSVIRQALAAAGVSGDEIDFVEPHGTGTRLGDAIEAVALTEALGPDGPPVHVGGVKSSIGHTNTAAGVAGLIKTVLAVESGYLPATLHVEEPTEELSRFGDRFVLTPQGRAWPGRGRPRTAGVSSFGVGGTNAHVIVQEAPSQARETR